MKVWTLSELHRYEADCLDRGVVGLYQWKCPYRKVWCGEIKFYAVLMADNLEHRPLPLINRMGSNQEHNCSGGKNFGVVGKRQKMKVQKYVPVNQYCGKSVDVPEKKEKRHG